MQELGGGHLVLDSVSSSRGQLQNLCQNEAGSTGPHLLLPCPAATWGTFPATSPGGVCSDVCVRVSETEIEKQTENSLPRPCPSRVTKHCRDLPPPLPSSH